MKVEIDTDTFVFVKQKDLHASAWVQSSDIHGRGRELEETR